MTSTQERHIALRDRLVDAAETQIVKAGLNAVKARDLAQMAQCSVGAIYTLVDDLPALILMVNQRTHAQMGREVAIAKDAARDAPPAERLLAISHAYLNYAMANQHRWRALFEVEMRASSDTPNWYLTAVQQLLELIGAPLRELSPEVSDEWIDILARGLFSAVHGIVLLGLENRASAVPVERLGEMIAHIVYAVAKIRPDGAQPQPNCES